jgi:hypothetical protein
MNASPIPAERDADGGGFVVFGSTEGSSRNAEEKEGRSTQMTPVARPPRSVQARPCTRRSVVLFLRVPRLRTHKYVASVTQTYNRCERVRAYMNTDCLSPRVHRCTVRLERIHSTCDCHPNCHRPMQRYRGEEIPTEETVCIYFTYIYIIWREARNWYDFPEFNIFKYRCYWHVKIHS